MAGGLLLGSGSSTNAQVNVQFGRNGTPAVTYGQPAYGQQPVYGQPVYGQQPAYGQYARPYSSPNYVQPGYYAPPAGSTYSSGYSAPAPAYPPGYGYGTTYATPYRPQPVYNGGYAPTTQPSYGGRTGVILNGRSYTLPR